MRKYKYIQDNSSIETLDINSIPQGLDYEIIEFEEDNTPIMIIPQEIQLWRIRTILKLMQLEQTIETALEQLDEPNKTAALSVWNYGTTIERYSQTVLLLQSILQMTDAQVDEIFIQADSIVI